MKKTAKEWYQHLPEPIRSQAMANWENTEHFGKNDLFSSLDDALNLWIWDDYWVDISIRAQRGEFDQPEPNLHGWIAVTDRLPDAGSEVLVIGDCDSDLSGFPEKNQVGIVVWDSVQKSKCKDWCYYLQWYTNIQFWQPLPKLPEVKGGGDGR